MINNLFHMKYKIWFIPLSFVLLGFCKGTFAQEVSKNVDLRPLLFRGFKTSEIFKKDGSVISALVNYNTNDQSILFINNSVYMELTGLNDIKEIRVDTNIFVPIENRFYLMTIRNNLFISYSNEVAVKDVTTDKMGSGLRDPRLSSNGVTNMYVLQNYKSPNGLVYVPNYWFMKEGHLLDLSNLKKVSISFGIGETLLKEFIKIHKINFENFENVNSFLDYLASHQTAN